MMTIRTKKCLKAIALICCLAGTKDVFSQIQLPYQNTALPVETRVQDIVGRLTLSEKIRLLQYRGTAINRDGLSIPDYNWWSECLHGVARAGKATVFPQAIGLAATWDAPFIQKVADVISDEARAKYEHFSFLNKRGIYQGLNFWTPNINIFRDPRWGRGMETYGEDPFLTGKMASAFIRGLQGNDPRYFKTIATVKHFVVHSGPEQSRHKFNADVSDRDFYETYTPAFKMAIQEAGVYSLMCAYNRFRDKPCCGSSFLLTDLLRRQWGFKGFIVTDCGAVNDFFTPGAHEVVPTAEEAAAMAIKAGVDLECGDVFNALDKAVTKKMVTEAELDNAIKRLFTARFKLGFFDKAADVPFTGIPYSTVENENHRHLSLEAARKSIVLLKNVDGALPLKKTVSTVAVIGPNANDTEVMLANYNGYPDHVVTPLEGIRKKIPLAKVLYAKGSRHAGELPSVTNIPSAFLFLDSAGSKPGLHADLYNNGEFRGEPVISRVDSNINFNWIDHSPGGRIDETDFSGVWQGYLRSPVSGNLVFDVYGSNAFELMVNGTKLVDFRSEHHAEHRYQTMQVKAGQVYALRLNYRSFGASPQLSLNWELPGVDLKKEALAIAAKADVVVLCMGLSPRVEGEEMKIKMAGFDGGDRTVLRLPDVQEDLIQAVVALGKPVILVLLNGSAVAVNWEQQHISGILETWYAGQRGGDAIADVLFGDYNPAGRLPVTFYKSEKDLPAFDNYAMDGRTYRYFKGDVLYPFGFGLSYTNFNYTDLRVLDAQDLHKPLKVQVNVQNTGGRDGEEVVQLYLKNSNENIAEPLRSLKGFKRIVLKQGEKRTVDFTLKPDDFKIIGRNGRSIVKPGFYEITVGGGQPGVKAAAKAGNVLMKQVRLTGKPII